MLLCVSDSEKEKKYKLVKRLSCISLTDDPCASGTTFKGIVYHLEEFSVRRTLFTDCKKWLGTNLATRKFDVSVSA